MNFIHFHQNVRPKKLGRFSDVSQSQFLLQNDSRCDRFWLLEAAHNSSIHLVSLPFLGLHQSSINPDMGEEWQERTVFVIYFNMISELLCFDIRFHLHKNFDNTIDS